MKKIGKVLAIALAAVAIVWALVQTFRSCEGTTGTVTVTDTEPIVNGLGYSPSSGSVADYNFLTIVDRGTVSIDEETVKKIIPDKTKKNKPFRLDLKVECSEDALIEMAMPSLNGFFRGNGNI